MNGGPPSLSSDEPYQRREHGSAEHDPDDEAEISRRSRIVLDPPAEYGQRKDEGDQGGPDEPRGARALRLAGSAAYADQPSRCFT
jgi:hypothetical protein